MGIVRQGLPETDPGPSSKKRQYARRVRPRSFTVIADLMRSERTLLPKCIASGNAVRPGEYALKPLWGLSAEMRTGTYPGVSEYLILYIETPGLFSGPLPKPLATHVVLYYNSCPRPLARKSFSYVHRSVVPFHRTFGSKHLPPFRGRNDRPRLCSGRGSRASGGWPAAECAPCPPPRLPNPINRRRLLPTL